MYGTVMLERQICPECGEWALILHNRTACCEVPAEVLARRRAQRMSEGSPVRRRPSVREKQRILRAQAYKCFYCNRYFGTLIERAGRISFLKLNWDHFIPFSYAMSGEHFVAACHICNSLKSDMIFETPEAAREYVLEARKKKGYSDVPAM